ncbi:tauPI-stichotoxin-Hcr2d-like [Amblyomma americanum]
MNGRTMKLLVVLAIFGAALACSDTSCREPKNPGPCQGYFPRYYFNKDTKTCEQFIFGGCQANGNNFATLQECQSRCG